MRNLPPPCPIPALRLRLLSWFRDHARNYPWRETDDPYKVLIAQAGECPRRLTPLECARLQGLPDRYQAFFDGRQPQPVSDTQAYRQFGNAVAAPVVTAIARGMVDFLAGFRVILG